MKNEALNKILALFKGKKVCVLGDVMLDKYLFGHVDRLSAEAPVPVLDVTSRRSLPGGAANAALNIETLDGISTIVSCIGNDTTGDRLLSILKKNHLATNAIVKDPSRQTTIKTRILSQQHHQQLLRIDKETRAPISDKARTAVIKLIKDAANTCDALLISDYSKGVVTPEVALSSVRAFTGKSKPVVVDSKAFDLACFKGATIFAPNLKEAEVSSGIRIIDDASLMLAGKSLIKKTGALAILITHGENGVSLFEAGGNVTAFPSLATEVFDVTGAGDTVSSVLALSLAAGADFVVSAFLANAAAGITVKKLGASAPTIDEIRGVVATFDQKQLVED
jgi:D-beta-D-heptose 7-phosphate kinase/D-beta-D-heptose 1-phosphate adenosyltransferase